MAHPPAVDGRPPPSLRAVVLVLAGTVAVAHFAAFGFLPAVSAIAAALGVSPAAVQASIGGYQALFAVGTLAAGWLADRVDKAMLAVAGMALVAAASLAVAQAASFESFLFWRCLQALGACSTFVVGRALAAELASGPQLVWAISVIAGTAGLAPLLAPAAGGWLAVAVGWRATFVAAAGYALAMAVLAWLLIVPLGRARRAAAAPGPRGSRRLLPPPAAVRHCAGIASGSFVFHLFMTTMPVMLAQRHGLSPAQIGVALMVPSIGFVGVAPIVGRVSRRSGLAPAAVSRRAQGALVAAAGLMLAVAAADPPAWALVLPALLTAVASGFVVPNGFAAASAAAGRDHGSVSGFLGFIQIGAAAAAGLLAALVAPLPPVVFGAATLAAAIAGLLVIRRAGAAPGHAETVSTPSHPAR